MSFPHDLHCNIIRDVGQLSLNLSSKCHPSPRLNILYNYALITYLTRHLACQPQDKTAVVTLFRHSFTAFMATRPAGQFSPVEQRSTLVRAGLFIRGRWMPEKPYCHTMLCFLPIVMPDCFIRVAGVGHEAMAGPRASISMQLHLAFTTSNHAISNLNLSLRLPQHRWKILEEITLGKAAMVSHTNIIEWSPVDHK